MATVGLRDRLSNMYRGWWVAVGGMAVHALLLGSTTGGNMGLFFVALERQFQWSRTLLSGAFSAVRVEGSVLGPVEGWLTDRLGPHKMVLMGFIIAGIGFLLLATVSKPIHFYVAMFVITAGIGIGGFVAVTTAVNWWFTRHRSTAIGIAMAGVGVGALWSPVIAWGVTTYGWRNAAAVIGVVLLAVGYPLSRMMRPPVASEEAGAAERPASARVMLEPEPDDGPELTVRQALRTRAFWVITLVHSLSGFTTTAVYVHGIPHLTDVGLSLQTAGYVMATFGAFEVIMRVSGSFLGDRMDKRYALSFYLTLQALGMVILALARTWPMALLFAIVFAIGHGGRGPLIVAIRGEYFGRRRFGTLMGIGNFFMSLFGTATPLLLGVLYDASGSYLVGFSAMAALTFVGGVLIPFASRPAPLLAKASQPAAS